MTEITDNTGGQLRAAITGGTGFVGAALARALLREGRRVVLIARRARPDMPAGAELAPVGLANRDALRRAFDGCDAVAHLAGINRERGGQTYQAVHVEGTANVVAAARHAGVRRLVMLSFLRARPRCGSAYHESKFQAEQIVRASGIPYTILKSGVIYGRGDHLLDHLSHALFTLPLFATVGFRQPPLRPIAVGDVVRILRASLLSDRLTNRTVAVTGPEELTMRNVVQRVAGEIQRCAWIVPMPVAFHRVIAAMAEASMDVPLVSRAQVRMLSEGLCEPCGEVDPLPEDLRPAMPFTAEQIRDGLPPPGPFTGAHLSLSCTAEAT
jgi:NADH dehydrogenase